MIKQISKVTLTLTLFAVISIIFVSTTQTITKDKIKINIKQTLIKSLSELITNDKYDNDILNDKITIALTLHNIEQTITIYLAKKKDTVIAYLIKHTYPNGYNGNIDLLTGIDANNNLLGIRVIAHKETPGLGDKIEIKKSNWITKFKGLSLTNTKIWKVKKDGGEFDQFTGATITPRAIVSGAYELLLKFNKIKSNIK